MFSEVDIMDQTKIGELISRFRKEKGLTQLQLGEMIGVSDKAVSKWERGLGCPDVSLLGALSAALGVNIEGILNGELPQNETERGNMKRIKFFVCPECGSISTTVGPAEISCCGRKLPELVAKSADAAHTAKMEQIDGEWFVTIPHEMTKSHHIMFAAYLSFDRVVMVRLYPEQDAQFRLPLMFGGKLFIYCSNDGLWVNKR